MEIELAVQATQDGAVQTIRSQLDKRLVIGRDPESLVQLQGAGISREHIGIEESAGRILLSGQASNTVHPDFAVARLLPNGTLDGSFSDDGRFSVDFFDASDGAENIAVQPDGKIVLGGFAQNGATVQYALARINP